MSFNECSAEPRASGFCCEACGAQPIMYTTCSPRHRCEYATHTHTCACTNATVAYLEGGGHSAIRVAVHALVGSCGRQQELSGSALPSQQSTAFAHALPTNTTQVGMRANNQTTRRVNRCETHLQMLHQLECIRELNRERMRVHCAPLARARKVSQALALNTTPPRPPSYPWAWRNQHC